MYVVGNGYSLVDVTDSDSVAYNASVSDPLSTFDFHVDDINVSILLDNFQEVIVWDENATPIQGSVPIPSMNYCLNPTLQNNTNGGGGTSLPNFFTSGTLSSSLWSYANNAPSVTFNNNALGYTYQNQQSTIFVAPVKPGQKYMFSVYVTGSGVISNIQAVIQFDYLDISGTFLSGAGIQPIPTTQTRYAVQAVAPANAAAVILTFGGQTTVAGTNSGTITFGTAQFEPMWFVDQGVSYPTPDCNFAQLNSVVLPNGTTSRKCRIFTGFIDDLEITYEGNQRFYDVKAVSNNSLLEDYALINSSYTSQYDTFIITDIITTSFSGVISIGQQNLQAPVSTIVQGQLIDQVTHVDMTFREVLNFLANTSGFLFYLDPYYYLHYIPQYYDVATFQLSDTPDYITSFPYESYTLQKDGTTRGNAIKLTGNKQNAAAIQDTFTGDGVTTVFNLTKPPFTVHTVTVNGVRQRTGIDGVDVLGSTFKALVNKQRLIITFQTAPPNTQAIVVEYTYEDAVISLVQSGDSYAKYNRWFWRKVNDSNMTSSKAATNRGIAEITKYAFPRQIPKFTTNNLSIPVGSTVLLTSQHDSLSQAAFTVQTVSVSHQGGGVYLYQYTTGAYNPTLLDHFRNTHKAINRPGYTSNVATQIVSYDSVLFDTITWNDVIVANRQGTQPAGKYGTAKYGFSSYS
jgi:hypothetical protein